MGNTIEASCGIFEQDFTLTLTWHVGFKDRAIVGGEVVDISLKQTYNNHFQSSDPILFQTEKWTS